MTISTAQFESLIREITGFSKEYQWPISIDSGIASFMKKHHIHSKNELYEKLQSSSDLLLEFTQQFTINETYFYREPLLFDLTTNVLVPELLIQRYVKGSLNILSAGCSTGEEPYSLVIAMMERYGIGSNKLFNFFAVDIDNESIMKAKKGIYLRRSIHMLDDRVIETYFYEQSPDQFTIKNDIINRVNFYQSSLQNISTIFPNQKMDIIFYRNVSIYFDPDTRQSIFYQLSDLLNPEGFLIMSPTETFAHDYKRLALIEKEGVFLFHCQKSKPSPLINKRTDHISHLQKQKSLDMVIELAKNKHYAYALDQLNDYIFAYKNDINASILKACILINQQELNEVRMICEEIYENDILNEAACLILGQVDRLEKKMDSARVFFKKVLYINNQNWLAHYYLAKINEENQRIESAIRSYQMVFDLLKKGLYHKHGLIFFPLSFSKSDLMFLCNTRIKKLKKEASNEF